MQDQSEASALMIAQPVQLQEQQNKDPTSEPDDSAGPSINTRPGPKPLTEVLITCQGTQGLLIRDPGSYTPGNTAKPQWLIRCLCPSCTQDTNPDANPGVGFSPDHTEGLLMGPSSFERHAGAGSSKKWKSSCRVADPNSSLCGRPVLAWLQQQGYEQTAGGADLGLEHPTADGSGSRGKGLASNIGQQQQQRQQLLLQIRLLLRDVALLPPRSPTINIGPGTGLGLQLPVKLPTSSCYSPAWQLHGSFYQHLPAAVALRGSSSSKAQDPAKPIATISASATVVPAAAAATAAAPAHTSSSNFSGVKYKRARVLRDGALTVIPYGHDENQLWLQRVHTFIGAVRRVLGRRQCDVSWGGSVLDSVVGAFITQAVSDVQSSCAFINLAATWPGPATVAHTAAAAGLDGAAAPPAVAAAVIAGVDAEGKTAGVFRDAAAAAPVTATTAAATTTTTTAAAAAAAAATAIAAHEDSAVHTAGSPGYAIGSTVAAAAATDPETHQGAASPPNQDQAAAAAGSEGCQEITDLASRDLTPWAQRGRVGVGADLVDWWTVMKAPQQQLEQALHGRGFQGVLSKRIQLFLRQLAADSRCVQEPAALDDTATATAAAAAAAAGLEQQETAADAAELDDAGDAAAMRSDASASAAQSNHERQCQQQQGEPCADPAVAAANRQITGNTAVGPSLEAASATAALMGTPSVLAHLCSKQQQQQQQQQQQTIPVLGVAGVQTNGDISTDTQIHQTLSTAATQAVKAANHTSSNPAAAVGNCSATVTKLQTSATTDVLACATALAAEQSPALPEPEGTATAVCTTAVSAVRLQLEGAVCTPTAAAASAGAAAVGEEGSMHMPATPAAAGNSSTRKRHRELQLAGICKQDKPQQQQQQQQDQHQQYQPQIRSGLMLAQQDEPAALLDQLEKQSAAADNARASAPESNPAASAATAADPAATVQNGSNDGEKHINAPPGVETPRLDKPETGSSSNSISATVLDTDLQCDGTIVLSNAVEICHRVQEMPNSPVCPGTPSAKAPSKTAVSPATPAAAADPDGSSGPSSSLKVKVSRQGMGPAIDIQCKDDNGWQTKKQCRTKRVLSRELKQLLTAAAAAPPAAATAGPRSTRRRIADLRSQQQQQQQEIEIAASRRPAKRQRLLPKQAASAKRVKQNDGQIALKQQQQQQQQQMSTPELPGIPAHRQKLDEDHNNGLPAAAGTAAAAVTGNSRKIRGQRAPTMQGMAQLTSSSSSSRVVMTRSVAQRVTRSSSRRLCSSSSSSRVSKHAAAAGVAAAAASSRRGSAKQHKSAPCTVSVLPTPPPAAAVVRRGEGRGRLTATGVSSPTSPAAAAAAAGPTVDVAVGDCQQHQQQQCDTFKTATRSKTVKWAANLVTEPHHPHSHHHHQQQQQHNDIANAHPSLSAVAAAGRCTVPRHSSTSAQQQVDYRDGMQSCLDVDQPAAAAAAAAGLRRSGRQRTPSRSLRSDLFDYSTLDMTRADLRSHSDASSSELSDCDDPDVIFNRNAKPDQTVACNIVTKGVSNMVTKHNSDSDSDDLASSSESDDMSLSSDTTVTSESDVSDDDGAQDLLSQQAAGRPSSSKRGSSIRPASLPAAAAAEAAGQGPSSSTSPRCGSQSTQHAKALLQSKQQQKASKFSAAAAVAAGAAAKAAVAAVAAAAKTGAPLQPILLPQLLTSEVITTPTTVDTAGTTCEFGDGHSRQVAHGSSSTGLHKQVAACDSAAAAAATADIAAAAAHMVGSDARRQQQQQVRPLEAVPPDRHQQLRGPATAAAATAAAALQMPPSSISSHQHSDWTMVQQQQQLLRPEAGFTLPMQPVEPQRGAIITTSPPAASPPAAVPAPHKPKAAKPGSKSHSNSNSSSSSSVLYIQVPNIKVRATATTSTVTGTTTVTAAAAAAGESATPLAAAAIPHKRLTLEWLRSCSVEEVRSLLSGVIGLGRKSIACVNLLTLGLKDFPVDVNVGRIAARLGWIPLQSASALESLDAYPAEPEVHKYLLDRLTRVTDVSTLYELHYMAITLGKVLCTKQLPHCSACPLQHVCEYALSGGERLQMGGPRRRVKPLRHTAAAAAGTASSPLGVSSQRGGRADSSRGFAGGRSSSSRKQASKDTGLAAAGWWLDHTTPWQYSSSSSSSRSSHSAAAAAAYDLEDLDILFAAAPRQRRNARILTSTAAGSSSSRSTPQRAWGHAAAAAGLESDDDQGQQQQQQLNNDPASSSPMLAGVVDQDDSWQQQQQHDPGLDDAQINDTGCADGSWQQLFDGLSQAAGVSCHHHQQQQHQQQQSANGQIPAINDMDHHGLEHGSHEAAALGSTRQQQQQQQGEHSSWCASAQNNTAVSSQAAAPGGDAASAAAPAAAANAEQLANSKPDHRKPDGAAGADLPDKHHHHQQQQQQPTALQQQQEQELARITAVRVPVHCALPNSQPTATAGSAELAALASASCFTVAAAAGSNNTARSRTAAAAGPEGAVAPVSGLECNKWCWEVLGLTDHSQQQQQPQIETSSAAETCNQSQATSKTTLTAAAAAAAAAEAAAMDNVQSVLTVREMDAAEHTVHVLRPQQQQPDSTIQLPTEAAIKAAYRNLAILLHPDKCKSPGAAAAFALVRRARTAAMQTLAAAHNTAAAAAASDSTMHASQQQQHTTANPNSTADVAITDLKPVVASNKSRRVAVGLQLTADVIALLDLPVGYLPPLVLGESQLPVLLLVEVPKGNIQLAEVERETLALQQQQQQRRRVQASTGAAEPVEFYSRLLPLQQAIDVEMVPTTVPADIPPPAAAAAAAEAAGAAGAAGGETGVNVNEQARQADPVTATTVQTLALQQQRQQQQRVQASADTAVAVELPLQQAIDVGMVPITVPALVPAAAAGAIGAAAAAGAAAADVSVSVNDPTRQADAVSAVTGTIQVWTCHDEPHMSNLATAAAALVADDANVLDAPNGTTSRATLLIDATGGSQHTIDHDGLLLPPPPAAAAAAGVSVCPGALNESTVGAVATTVARLKAPTAAADDAVALDTEGALLNSASVLADWQQTASCLVPPSAAAPAPAPAADMLICNVVLGGSAAAAAADGDMAEQHMISADRQQISELAAVNDLPTTNAAAVGAQTEPSAVPKTHVVAESCERGGTAAAAAEHEEMQFAASTTPQQQQQQWQEQLANVSMNELCQWFYWWQQQQQQHDMQWAPSTAAAAEAAGARNTNHVQLQQWGNDANRQQQQLWPDPAQAGNTYTHDNQQQQQQAWSWTTAQDPSHGRSSAFLAAAAAAAAAASQVSPRPVRVRRQQRHGHTPPLRRKPKAKTQNPGPLSSAPAAAATTAAKVTSAALPEPSIAALPKPPSAAAATAARVALSGVVLSAVQQQQQQQVTVAVPNARLLADKHEIAAAAEAGVQLMNSSSGGSSSGSSGSSDCSHCHGINGPSLCGILLIPVLSALRGAFPLNGTYFQVHEIFLDQRTLMQPLLLQHKLVQAIWQQLGAAGSHSSGAAAAAAARGDVGIESCRNRINVGDLDVMTNGTNAESAPAAAAVTAATAATAAAAAAAPPANTAAADTAAAALQWTTVYLGSSASSICSGMSTAELSAFFQGGCMCIRSYDPVTGGVSLRLPTYLAPSAD